MSQTVDEAFRRACLYSDGLIYRMLKLPPNAITLAAGVVAEIGSPYCALVVDKDEISLMLPDEAQKTFGARMRDAEISERQYRLITLDVMLEPDLVGFMARLANALAGAGIPLLSFAAYSRDHIFVPRDDFDAALRTLRQLQEEYI